MDIPNSRQNWLDTLGVASSGAARSGGLSRDDRNPRRNFLSVATVALVTMVLLGPIMTNDVLTLSGQGSSLRPILYLVIVALTFYACYPVATRESLIAIPWPVLLALAWCWVSLFWALNPDVGARRVFLLTVVVWTVFCLVRHSSYQSLMDTIRLTLLASLLISYLYVLINPGDAIHQMQDSAIPTALAGNWRGIFGHKNFAGAVAAICIILFIFDAKRFPAALRIGIILFAAFFLFRSFSKTSMGVLGIAILCGLIFEFVNRRLRAYLIPILAVGVATIGVLISAYQDVFELNVLNPASFTGRGLIWSVLLKFVADHPWLGSGYGSFWNIGTISPVFQYGHGYVQMITVGHSGYIDTLVAIGVPGLILVVFAAIIWPLWRLLSSGEIEKGRAALISALLMFCIGHNVTESGLFERDAIVGTFFFFAIALARYAITPEVTRGRSSGPSAPAGDDLLREMRQRGRRRKEVEAPAKG